MIRLNIIPKETKKEIAFKDTYRSIVFILYLITISAVSYAIALLVCKTILQIHLDEISSQNTIVTKNTDNYSKQVKDINKQILAIEKIQAENIVWTSFIDYIFDNLNDDIKIARADFNKKDNSLTLNGLAGTRKGLIDLKQYFENNKNFTVLSFPIQNLVEKNNINFEIRLTINSFSIEQ